MNLSQALGATARRCRRFPIGIVYRRVAQVTPWLPARTALGRTCARAFGIAAQRTCLVRCATRVGRAFDRYILILGIVLPQFLGRYDRVRVGGADGRA